MRAKPAHIPGHLPDAEGWLVYACSWESGQDVSSRFGPQQTGGTIIQHVRPVDLQASMAQGGEILARWAPLSWPPVVMTLVGAAAAAHMPLDAAELAYRYIDASCRSTDSHELDEQGDLPGVTREYRRTITVGKWGEVNYVNAGIAGYGWGALSVHLLIRYLLGLREEEVDYITVSPALPQALCRTGATYYLEAVPWGRYTLSIACTVKNAKSYRLRLSCLVLVAGADLQGIQDRDRQQGTEEHQYEWEGVWGEGRTLQLPQLTISAD